ncbi:UNVERIFIED_CONTAM: hypothetical protein RMT77_009624 [Armadillidium vulgare]
MWVFKWEETGKRHRKQMWVFKWEETGKRHRKQMWVFKWEQTEETIIKWDIGNKCGYLNGKKRGNYYKVGHRKQMWVFKWEETGKRHRKQMWVFKWEQTEETFINWDIGNKCGYLNGKKRGIL